MAWRSRTVRFCALDGGTDDLSGVFESAVAHSLHTELRARSRHTFPEPDQQSQAMIPDLSRYRLGHIVC